MNRRNRGDGSVRLIGRVSSLCRANPCNICGVKEALNP